jgi:alcohol dehydrogenase class IV
MTGFFTGPPIAWGTGAIEQLSSLSVHRASVILDPALSAHPLVRRVVEELEKTDATVEVVPVPVPPDSVPNVDGLAERLAGPVPDWIVVVGGGRTIDAAKAARMRVARPDVALDRLTPMVDLPEPLPVRLAAVPTTSGSGSEATGTSDLWAADGTPLEVSHRALTPDWALVDPAFAATLPPALVLDGALETAAIATEAYLSAWSNPFSDALALDALGTVVRRLAHAVKWSDDPDARAALHHGATGAGLAAANAQRGVAHALARALVRPTGLSYGRLLGIVLPAVLEYDRPAARDRIEVIARAVAPPDERPPVPLDLRLRRLYPTLGFPADLGAAGVPADRLAKDRATIVAHTLRSPAVLANPRVPTPEEVGGLLDAVTRHA